jgi:hypothetical protein
MSEGGNWKQVLRRSPLLQRALTLFRRLAGSDPARMDHLQRQLDLHGQAIQRMEGGLEPRVAAVEQHLPTLLNTIASGRGVNRRLQREVSEIAGRERDFAQSLADVWSRIEMIRREVMFELRYGDHGDRGLPSVESKIVDEEKVRAAREAGLRLNLGCGHIPIDGYVNVDMRDLPGVDVIAPVDAVPFEAGEVVEVFNSHLVEHFPQEQFVREVLPYWVSLLRPGGTLRVVLPDAGSMLDGFAEGTVSYDDLREVLYGGQEYEGDYHFNMYTSASLASILEAAGLTEVTVEAEGRRNGACLEMQLSARRAF